jgi:hypothetical protein
MQWNLTSSREVPEQNCLFDSILPGNFSGKNFFVLLFRMMPFECYKTYLAMKQHFTKDSYDYLKYCGRSKASLQSFYKRKDRYFFEKMSRQHSDNEIENFFIANFVGCDDPQTLYIVDIIQNGEQRYRDWQKRTQSLSYIFRGEIEATFSGRDFDSLFKIEENRHPQIVKEFIRKNISIETLIIIDKIIKYKSTFDKKLNDPVWKLISQKMNKYSPFLNIDVPRYTTILKEVIL